MNNLQICLELRPLHTGQTVCASPAGRWYDVKSTVDISSIPGSIMSIRFTHRGTYLIFTVISAVAALWTDCERRIGRRVPLTQHYNDAQKLQRTGKLNEAVEQYRAFLADALGELAIGYGLAQDYTHAAPLFDEALTLEPDSPSLLLDYARTALMLGDLDHAKTLATEFIQKIPGRSREARSGTSGAWPHTSETESGPRSKKRARSSRRLGSDLPQRL